MYGGQNQNLPIKLNMTGVMPIIFASSIVSLVPTILAFCGVSEKNFWVRFFAADGVVYPVSLFLLIIAFAYFYTQVTLNPTEIAKQIRENGGSIPGIRIDKTEEYMQRVLNRLILPGSLYLALIAVLPTIIQNIFEFPQSIAMLMGGTSLLILVGVDLDKMNQVDAVLKMHHVDGLVKKGSLKSHRL